MMKLAHIKTGILVVLVALSLVLSYVLWRGNWQNSSEVSFTDVQSTARAQSPQVGDVVTPYQILFTSSAEPNRNTIGMPDTPLYAEWMRRLSDVAVTGWKSASQENPPSGTYVEYDFGGTVNTSDVARWVPTFAASTATGRVSKVVLYSTGDAKKPVRIRYETEGASYEADTDIDTANFIHDVQMLIKQNPWEPWNARTNSYVPATDTTASAFVMSVIQPSVVPLVHSYFVNPQVLTRAQEGQDTTLWTDGSQVVWWNDAADTLTYADPNTTRAATSAQQDLGAAVEFMRNHGGTRLNTILYETDSTGSSTSFTFRTYVNGLPIVGSAADYLVQVQNGKILRYQRPIHGLGERMSESTVPVIGLPKLTGVIQSLLPNVPEASLKRSVSVEFGYLCTINAGQNTASLNPVYYITEGGALLGVIDAQTGAVMKGMGQR